jgi:cytochrome c biogenesis protein CcmG, thiol:disulfide interchange protein DsbE
MTSSRRFRNLLAWRNWRLDPWTVLLVVAIVYLWFRPPAWVSEEQKQIPNITIGLLDGRVLRLEQLRGEVVVVNFWATWCPYCRHEMPAMADFYRDYHQRGFEILALSQDQDQAAAARFMSHEAYPFPAAMADASSNTAFGEVKRLPTSFIIDKQGRLRYKISGQLHYARLKTLVEPLLDER